MSLIPINSIKANLGIEPNGKVQKFFTNTCAKHMEKYVPRDTGMLRTNIDVQADSVTYKSPYAHYQYRGERADGTHKVKRYTTPGTGPYWDKRMVSAEMQSVVKEVQDYIRSNDK